jgi:ABC-type cobalamin/Fe3+-siderophores transport system ATPase subunit
MILLSALVQNARVLTMNSPVTFDPTKINIVRGPNGSWKSTMFEMMHDAL